VLLKRATHRGVAINKNWGDWFLGAVYYHRNELEAAAQHFTQIVENRYTAQITTYRDAVAGLALIHLIKGESSEAFQVVELISQFDLEQRGSEDKRTRSLRARLMLLHGDLEGANRWAETFTDPLLDQTLMWLEEPQVTLVRVLVARGTDTDLHLALQKLDALEEIADRTHKTRFKIELLALRALALDAQEKTSEANAVLNQAINLARLGGFIRVFVDLGEPMQVMLRRLVNQNQFVETIQRILVSFPEDEKNLVSSERHPPHAKSTLIEPLTRRELEVLNLLRGPLSIKEIAQNLNIAYATAKGHTINIYAKLGVNQRRNAVTRAEEMNILPPH
jgi:LuxR family maltose regulon positive regulatory protein